jgi:single-strand DNA-binding protein
MINRVIIAGRLGADPDVRSIGNDNRVARLSVATNESWHGADGEPKEVTHWHAIVLFKQQSIEFAERNFKKGDLVGIEGALEHRSYEKDGRKTFVSEVVVRAGRGDVTMLAKAERPEQQPEQRRERGPARSPR